MGFLNNKTQATQFVAQHKKDKIEVDVRGGSLTEDEQNLVEKLSRIHGPGILYSSPVKKELRLADPELLLVDGEKELRSKHLYVNITLYLSEHVEKCARCAKDGRTYTITELLLMRPLEERMDMIPNSFRKVYVSEESNFCDIDENGNLIPPRPGECVSVAELSENHPAIYYLKNRDYGFDPNDMCQQFKTSFCIEHNSTRSYGKLPGGFLKSPQNRLVFFIEQFGKNRGWQARFIEKIEDDKYKLLHTNTGEWATIADKTKFGWLVREPFLFPGYDEDLLLKSRFIIGLGTKKNETLLGFDAAKLWNENTEVKTIGLVEGVFDAARMKPPFCSIMGMTLTYGQACLVADNFNRALIISDQDEKETNQIQFFDSMKQLKDLGVEVIDLTLPKGVKDAAKLTEKDAKKLVNKFYV